MLSKQFLVAFPLQYSSFPSWRQHPKSSMWQYHLTWIRKADVHPSSTSTKGEGALHLGTECSCMSPFGPNLLEMFKESCLAARSGQQHLGILIWVTEGDAWQESKSHSFLTCYAFSGMCLRCVRYEVCFLNSSLRQESRSPPSALLGWGSAALHGQCRCGRTKVKVEITPPPPIPSPLNCN